MSYEWHKVLGSHVKPGEWVTIEIQDDVEFDGIFELASEEGVILQTGDPEIIVTGRTWLPANNIVCVETGGDDQVSFAANSLVRTVGWAEPTTSLKEILEMLRQTREVFSVRLESLRFARVLSVEDEVFQYEWRNPSGSYFRTIWAQIDSILYLSWGHVAHEQMTESLDGREGNSGEQ